MQGLSANHFATEAAPVQPGQTVLVHAAAGGLGRILVQLVKIRGGRVIGLVSREDKVEVARTAGADEVLVSTGDQFVQPVLELTSGQGVDTVFDGGGETTFWASTRVARRHGTVLYYGAVIGQVPVVARDHGQRVDSVIFRTTASTIALAMKTRQQPERNRVGGRRWAIRTAVVPGQPKTGRFHGASWGRPAGARSRIRPAPRPS